MVGLIVAAHGRLGEELLTTAQQIVGLIPNATSCSVGSASSLDDIRHTIAEKIASVDDGQGVLVLVDLIGGSPCTQSLMLCRQTNIEVLTGVNLPMVLKAAGLRNSEPAMPLRELAQHLLQYGQKNITWATENFRASSGA
jgi:PTS system mannose-specific IIA component